MMTDFSPCVGSGHCCLTAQCALGAIRYGRHPVCPGLFEEGDRYRCRLVIEDAAVARDLAVGAGCSSTLFNVRREKILRKFKG
jgi:hypothetical protein